MDGRLLFRAIKDDGNNPDVYWKIIMLKTPGRPQKLNCGGLGTRINYATDIRAPLNNFSIYISTYIAPLQGNYSEALPAQARPNRRVLRSL